MTSAHKKTMTGILMVYLLSMFLITSSTIGGYALLAVMYGLLLILPTDRYFLQLPKPLIVCVLAVGLCLSLSIAFADYDQRHTVTCFGCLIMLYILIENGMLSEALEDPPRIDWFYLALLTLTIVNMIHAFRQGGQDFIIAPLEDKNLTAIFFYYLFMYSNKKRYYSGIAIAFFYGLFLTTSRSFVLLLLLFYICWFMPKEMKEFLDRHRIRMIVIFALLFLAVAVFSYIWVYSVSNTGLVGYKAGLNDGSNRMRFVANIKAFQMLADPSQALLWGYGSGLYEVLGILSDDTSKHMTFLGVRLVQPHNSLIHPLVTMGILPGALYLYAVTRLLDRFNTKENIPYLYPYLVNAMILPWMFELKWLAFWILILATPQREKHIWK